MPALPAWLPTCLPARSARLPPKRSHPPIQAETDPSEILNELIQCCRKGGRVSIAGAYAGCVRMCY